MLKILFVTCIAILSCDAQPLSGLTAVSGRWKQMVKTQVVPPYSKAINKFTFLLEHLATPVATEEEIDWVLWALEASEAILGLHSDLQKSHQGSQDTIGAMNKELEKMADQSSRIDSQLLQKTKEVEKLGVSVAGAERSVRQARRHLNEAQRSLESHERAVRVAEAKYYKAKNECFKRKKRATDEEDDSGVPVLRGLRHKRDIWGNIWGEAQLQDFQNKLSTDQASLNAVRKSKETLEGNKRKLLGEIKTLGRLNEDLKDVTGLIGRLKTRGAKLVEVVGLALLDAELFLKPLEEAAELIRSRAISGANLPLLPAISDSTSVAIQTNLAAFMAALPDFPLIFFDE